MVDSITIDCMREIIVFSIIVFGPLGVAQAGIHWYKNKQRWADQQQYRREAWKN